MRAIPKNTFKPSPFVEGSKLHAYCRQFKTELTAIHPELLDKLQLLADGDGSCAGLRLFLVCPRRVQSVELEVVTIESKKTVVINFNGAQTEITSPSKAAQLLHDILNDEVLCVSRFINERLSQSWLASPLEANDLLESNRYLSRGCLDYFLPARMQRIKVTSWSSKLDGKSVGW
jgi:hypothetical protein